MSEQQMSMSNVRQMIDRSERIINNTPALLSLLRNAEFTSEKMNLVKTVLPEGNPPLGIVFSQLHAILYNDEALREIIRSECEENFEDDPMFPFFIFWCSVVMYTRYLEIKGKQETRSEE